MMYVGFKTKTLFAMRLLLQVIINKTRENEKYRHRKWFTTTEIKRNRKNTDKFQMSNVKHLDGAYT